MKPHHVVLTIAVITLLFFVFGCSTVKDVGSQGHTSWTTFFAALVAAVVAFIAAPLDALIAIGAGIAAALALMAFSPKYPLNPPRTPDGHQVAPPRAPEKSFFDKTWWEVITGHE